MKTQLTRLFAALTLLALSTLNPQLSTAFAQGTAFTYQGRLYDGTNRATGSYDLTFAVFTDSNGVNQVGSTLTNTATGITNGLFTVVLDFGPGIFTGTPLWLQIGAETNGGGGFTTLAPLQQLTPAPYAIYSPSAGSAVSANGVAAGSVTGAGIAGNSVVKSLNNLQDAVSLLPGANVTITPSGNTLTIASSGGGGGGGNNWSLTGNGGTTPGVDFLGTTDNQPLELHVNGVRGLRLEPSFGDPQNSAVLNVVGGSPANFVTGGAFGATISGGGAANSFGTPGSNSVTGDYGTVSGGLANTAAYLATVGGGANNSAINNVATVGGGNQNTASGFISTVGGGGNNNATLDYATISGGFLNTAGGQFATVGGGYGNQATAEYSIVAGGLGNIANGTNSTVGGGNGNQATGPGSFVGGGGYDGTTFAGNTAAGAAATVAGGIDNQATTPWATVGGGAVNTSSSAFATVGGGHFNTSGGEDATVGGGDSNQAEGTYATIPGGESNVARGQASFAAGQNATANDNNSFVWGDGTRAAASQGSNSFAALATGGVWFYTDRNSNAGAKLAPGATSWTAISDRNAKKNFQPVDTVALLDKLAAIPIEQWNYKWEKDTDVPNIGPMAQDFIHAFYPGRDDKGISTLEFDGVELAAIQGLNQKVEEKETRIQEQAGEIADLKARLEKLEQLVNSKNGEAK